MHAAIAGWLLGVPSGANRRLLALLAQAGPLLSPGERITVLHRPDFAPPSLPGIGWQPVRIPAAPTWRRVLAERRRLPAALRALGASVYEHGFLPLPPVPVPVVLLAHDLRAVDGLTRWPRALAAWVLRTSLQRAVAIVAPSAWTAGRLAALAPEAVPPIVVPNAADAPPPDPAAPQPLPPAGYLLHAGHVEPRKNLAVVVDALALLPPATRPALWLAGHDAGALPALRARARAASVALRAFGTVDDRTLHGLYHAARAVVLPSRHEGFGLPALEALAHGRPVLVADAGALPEVVGAAGERLPADDAAVWARAIAATAVDRGDPAARRAHAATFSWPAAAQRWIRVLRQASAR